MLKNQNLSNPSFVLCCNVFLSNVGHLDSVERLVPRRTIIPGDPTFISHSWRQEEIWKPQSADVAFYNW